MSEETRAEGTGRTDPDLPVCFADLAERLGFDLSGTPIIDADGAGRTFRDATNRLFDAVTDTMRRAARMDAERLAVIAVAYQQLRAENEARLAALTADARARVSAMKRFTTEFDALIAAVGAAM